MNDDLLVWTAADGRHWAVTGGDMEPLDPDEPDDDPGYEVGPTHRPEDEPELPLDHLDRTPAAGVFRGLPLALLAGLVLWLVILGAVALVGWQWVLTGALLAAGLAGLAWAGRSGTVGRSR